MGTVHRIHSLAFTWRIRFTLHCRVEMAVLQDKREGELLENMFMGTPKKAETSGCHYRDSARFPVGRPRNAK